MVGQDLVNRHRPRQLAQDMLHRDARTFDDGFAKHNRWVDLNAVVDNRLAPSDEPGLCRRQFGQGRHLWYYEALTQLQRMQLRERRCPSQADFRPPPP